MPERQEIIEKLKKLRAKADSTIFKGEKKVFEAKIDELLEKYEIDSYQISGEDTEGWWRTFRLRGFEREAAVMIAFYLKLSPRIPSRGVRGEIMIKANDAESSLFWNLWSFHVGMLRHEKKKILLEFGGLAHGYLSTIFPLDLGRSKKVRRVTQFEYDGYMKGKEMAKRRGLEMNRTKLIEGGEK